MVIEQGNYDAFKRCAMRLLDYARVSEVINSAMKRAGDDCVKLKLTGEQFEASRVVLRFDFDFSWLRQEFNAWDIHSYFEDCARKLDVTVREFWMGAELVRGLKRRRSADWMRSVKGKEGHVAFLMEVPYPCEPPEPTFVGNAWEAQLRYDAVTK